LGPKKTKPPQQKITNIMQHHSKIFVAGHRGLLGSALVRRLTAQGYNNILTVDRSQLDLNNQSAVDAWFDYNKPEYVLLAAAQVFGIAANVSGEVILNNLRVSTNVIDAARRSNCKKLLFPGSNCVYPKFAKIPITENQLLTGELEPTSESYAAAKIAGIMMCRHFRKQWGFNAISVMPCNLYGPGDKYDLEHAHVMAAMINKFVTARRQGLPAVTLWGNGSARREFLYSDDAADAAILCMQQYDHSDPINIASGEEVTVKHLAETIRTHTGYQGEIVWDTSKPTGTLVKSLDVSKITALGWKPKYSLAQGIPSAIQEFETLP
jgi:GDP-L-fucose synthase